MEKEKPYPCKKGEYKMKDGIHISFPDIIIEKSIYLPKMFYYIVKCIYTFYRSN